MLRRLAVCLALLAIWLALPASVSAQWENEECFTCNTILYVAHCDSPYPGQDVDHIQQDFMSRHHPCASGGTGGSVWYAGSCTAAHPHVCDDPIFAFSLPGEGTCPAYPVQPNVMAFLEQVARATTEPRPSPLIFSVTRFNG